MCYKKEMQESPKNYVPKFFNYTSTSYEKIVKYCTFGKDRFWKNKILSFIHDGESFLDLACGTGILTRELSRKFPGSSIIGVDITKSYLEQAKANSKSNKNISFLHQDAESLDIPKKFDCITASYLPKYCDASIIVTNCLKHLNPKGKIIFHDFIYPKNYLVRILWEIYFKILNFVGFFIPSWKESFVNLPRLIRVSKWQESYENELRKAGLEVSSINLTWNSAAIIVAKKI